MASKTERKERLYEQATLEKAVEKIRGNQISLSQASSTYNIPKGTLHNKVHGKTPLVCKKGPSTILTHEEESHIATWIINMAKVGYPVSHVDLKDTVAQLFEKRGQPDIKPGKKWFRLFLNRHPEITQRHAEIISKARASVTEVGIRKWFADLTNYMLEQNTEEILNCPERIFNLDETGVQLCPKSGVVLAPKNYRAMYTIASGQEKQCVTVLCNFSVIGGIVPPFVVYPLQRISKEIAQSVPDDWGIGRSDSGWMTSATFLEYIREIFLPWLQLKNIQLPFILFVDGHKSHINIELHDFCVEHQIIVYCLHPNTTHIMQPCDVGIFGPLKAAWKNMVRKHKLTENFQLTRSNFVKVFSKAFDKAVTENVIKSGFKACGLSPFNPDAVDYSKCISTRKADISREVALQDYKTTISVIQKTISSQTLEKYKDYREQDKRLKSALFFFWNKCMNKLENMMSTQSNIDDSNTAVNVSVSLENPTNTQANHLATNTQTNQEASTQTNHDTNTQRNYETNTQTNHEAYTKTNHEEDLSMTLGIDSIVEGLLDIVNIPIDIQGCNVLLDDILLEDCDKNTAEISSKSRLIEEDTASINGSHLNETNNKASIMKTANINPLDTSMQARKDATESTLTFEPMMDPLITSTPKRAIPHTEQTYIDKTPDQNSSVLEESSDQSIYISDFFKIPEEKKPVKRKFPTTPSMPLAITSKKFKEYVENKENDKKRKADEIKQRKIEREQKKTEKENKAKEKKLNIKTKAHYKKVKIPVSQTEIPPENTFDESESSILTQENTNNTINECDTLYPLEEVIPKNVKSTVTKNILKNTTKSNTQIPVMTNIEIGNYVVVEFKTNKRNRYYVGVVEECDLGTDFIKAKFLRKKSSKLDNLIYFVEPSTVDLTEVAITDVKKKLTAPEVGRRRMLNFIEPNFDLNLCE